VTGLYAAGAQLVRYLAYFLFPVIDVVYPRLASIEFSRPRVAGPILLRSLFLSAALGTTAFFGLALDGAGALALWAGAPATLSVAVVAVYGLAYAIITPAHILVIGMVARGSHRTVAIVILTEAIVNLGLSIVLTMALGPLGPAISTLIVVAVDDLLVIPWIASRALSLSLQSIVRANLAGVAVGAAILAVSRVIPGEDVAAALGRAAVEAGLVTIVLILGVRSAIGALAAERDPGIAEAGPADAN
jgi:O-antigen/teichoic acid export membrane protein